MKNTLELKQFVNDDDFIQNMNIAFSDLRADYELTMDSSDTKIAELTALHVDIKNHLSDLTAFSRNSSGTISGLRGTGKTHLLLLARNNINSSLWKDAKSNNLCIYLNMKRICIPETFSQDLYNRIFSVYIYNELAKQLLQILLTFVKDTVINRLLSKFDYTEKKLKKNIELVIKNLYEMQIIARNGNEIYNSLSTGTCEAEEYDHTLINLTTKLNETLSLQKFEAGIQIDMEYLNELSHRLKTNNTYTQFLNFQSVRHHLIDIINLLQLDSITFYVDEWEKISYNPLIQEYTSFYIDRIQDTPLYFWISIVPYRGNLYYLDNGADLQHQINLDDSLVYEASDRDRILCLTYFKNLINNRLSFYFNNEDINYNLLFNNDENFEKLVLAGMGNTRDFGTMLLKCWSEYQTYRNSPMAQGRPYKYIAQPMIVEAIKDNGDKKMTNIQNNPNTMKAWNDVKNFCLQKKSSHFSIEENGEDLECFRAPEFSDLIYHRLLHFRKAHVPAKDAETENKLSIYAINYAAIYSLHAQDRKITFVTKYELIHDRVRRYIYKPSVVLNDIKVATGEIFPCINCRAPINVTKMKAAWEKNSCPFCGDVIHN